MSKIKEIIEGIEADSNLFENTNKIFKELNIPLKTISSQRYTPREFFQKSDKYNDIIDGFYTVALVDDQAFQGEINAEDLTTLRKRDRYNALAVFAVDLNIDDPARGVLAEITRLINRELQEFPAVVVFRYGQYLALASSERSAYLKGGHVGEKVGKVALLRDISTEKVHPGHLQILEGLSIKRTGKNAISTYDALYKHWHSVFSVTLLNKQFYRELSNWYFWALKNVTFPSQPTIKDVHEKYGTADPKKLLEMVQEHNAKNVIRLLTRLLFTWFLKEKKLVPEELFDLKRLQTEILKDIDPVHSNGIFKDANIESIYYKAVLQNLFFATLNCPIEPDTEDSRERSFRGDGYGQNRGIDYLMRYKEHFKDPDKFLELMNSTVPFLNGGLFECLDNKDENLYIDGFSDGMATGNHLVVPDYLFFGLEEKVDLSAEYGESNRQTKEAAVKGLINILKSYKFTITENTPVEEEVALDPELLGKVFENLLASYNPETKSTARKQTGSFYTPREIVDYMVDESLIAYLKHSIENEVDDIEQLDKDLHALASFDLSNPFVENEVLTRKIVEALDQCKILDPACGSGAFPMGVLQKMVHMLQKLDPQNSIWKETQRKKVLDEAEDALEIMDKDEREQRLIEINNAFDENMNNPDFARKLFLIENCIYGVDIQPIATQISKLRFFISLVVEQKVQKEKPNFGVRPLPNLETKFVTANSLIGIEKPSTQTSLFNTTEIKKLEKELKSVRHKLFSARTKKTKLSYRAKDEVIRDRIASEMKSNGWPENTATLLANWDPYDQNASSPFFDPEWMFDVKTGFNIVIGNPPYVNTKSGIQKEFKDYYKDRFKSAVGQFDLFSLFIELSLELSDVVAFIVPKPLINNENYEVVRKLLLRKGLQSIVTGSNIFENAGVESSIFLTNPNCQKVEISTFNFESGFVHKFNAQTENFDSLPFTILNTLIHPAEYSIIELIMEKSQMLGDTLSILRGVEAGKSDISINSEGRGNSLLRGEDLGSFKIEESNLWINADFNDYSKYKSEELYRSPKICIRRVGNSVISAVDINDKVSLNTIYNCHFLNNIDDNYYGISALLNSSLINYWFRKVFVLDDTLFPYLRVSQLEKIPLKVCDEIPEISLLSKILHHYNSPILCEVLNSLVINLYFDEHMSEYNIDIVDLVRLDLNESLGKDNFDTLSSREKDELIEQLTIKWSDPNNEVVKRISLFKEKSPDILKPILEA